MGQRFRVGEPVIYRKQKHSTRPGPRAKQVDPAGSGEQYTYLVDKYWRVVDVLDDGRLRVATRRGKRHLLDPDDPRLNPVRWWEKLLYQSRFPAVPEADTESGGPAR